MFVFLSKLLEPLVYPLGVATAMWAVALVLWWRGRAAGAPRALAGGIAVVLVFSNPQVADSLLGSLEEDYPPAPVDSYPTVDAIVVLGGATKPPLWPRLEVEVTEAFDRLLHGMRLLRAGKADLLVLSGGVIRYLSGSDFSEAARLARLAEEYGVRRDQLWLEERSRNTHENGLYTAQYLREHGRRRVLLVTSASHMRRAAGVFRREGLEAIPAPTDFRVVEMPLTPMRLFPDVEALWDSSRAFKEYVGLFVYWLWGWTA